ATCSGRAPPYKTSPRPPSVVSQTYFSWPLCTYCLFCHSKPRISIDHRTRCRQCYFARSWIEPGVPSPPASGLAENPRAWFEPRQQRSSPKRLPRGGDLASTPTSGRPWNPWVEACPERSRRICRQRWVAPNRSSEYPRACRTKKRPPVSPAWMMSRSGEPEGRGAAITRKCLSGRHRRIRLASSAEAHRQYIFWTGEKYRGQLFIPDRFHRVADVLLQA